MFRSPTRCAMSVSMNEPDVANVAFPAWSVPRELILLMVITMAVFAPSLAAPFHLDDGTLLSDPIVTSPSGWWHVWRPLQTRPLTWFTFWINYAVFGENPTGWHATNVLLHAITVFLAYRLFWRVTISRAAAITAAALFALHPIQAEAVVYVFERATILSTLFCLLSAEAWLNGNLPRAIGCFVFALLSKEECVLFPLFLLLLRREIKPVLIMLALSVAAGLRVILAIELLGIRGAGSGAGISPFEYLLTQGTVILRYVRMLVLPHGFTCDPAISVITDWRAYACWAAVLLAAGLVWKFAAAGTWVVAGLVLLLPSSSIFPAEDLAADRRFYLPMIAFAGFAALTLPITQKAVRLCAATAMLLCMFVTSYRVYVWRSEERLWAEAVQRGPEKLRPRILLSRLVDDVTAIRLLRDAKSNAPSDHRARVRTRHTTARVR